MISSGDNHSMANLENINATKVLRHGGHCVESTMMIGDDQDFAQKEIGEPNKKGKVG